MNKIIKILFLLGIVYSSVNSAVPLTVININATLGHLDNAGIIPTANECFAFKNFINTANFPAAATDRIAAINRLRELLNSNNFSDNTILFLQNTEFLSNKLMNLEIVYRNAQNTQRINEVRRMMVHINLPSGGTASGILIPIPDRFNPGAHHSWGVLTSGHILDDIPIEKKVLPHPIVPEVLTADLNIPIMLPQIPIHSIKVFKTNSVQLQNNNGGIYEGLGDNVVNALDIRGIPRYEYPADLALCYLNLTLAQIHLINQSLLLPPVGGAVYPHIGYNAVNHRISFQTITNFTCNVEFVTNVARKNALVTTINAQNKLNNFVLGYPSYNAVLTLSKARQNTINLYPNFIDPDNMVLIPENQYMFFHDAPTYPGMSGGPVFNTPNGNNEINIFGVVQGYNSPNPDDNVANNSLQSRCGASFIMAGIIN